jgi:hypothetical protein
VNDDAAKQTPERKGPRIPADVPAPVPPPGAAGGFWSASMPAHANPAEHAFDVSPPDPEVERAKSKRRVASSRLAKLQKKLKPRLCEHCKYDITGLPGDRCPECGEENSRASALRAYDPHWAAMEEESRAIARRTYLRPIILAAIGLAMMGATLAIQQQDWQLYVAHLIIWLAQIPLGMLALWISQQFIVEYDGRWPLTSLRFAAIYALIGNIPLWIPIPFVPAIVTYIALLGLCVTELDVEGYEARLIAAIMWVMGVAAWLTVLWVIR